MSTGKALRVTRIDPDGGEWDRYVGSMIESTHCHRAGWREVMSDVLGHECHYLAAQDDGGVWRGVLPIVRVRGLLGHFLVSMPFLNDGGPLGDALAQKALVEHAVREGTNLGATLIEFRTRQQITGPVTTSNRKITVRLELPDSVEALWAQTF